MVRIGQFAADVHWRMCDDPRFGYSWVERWGAYPLHWDVDGVPIVVMAGDYDCSSSSITAWRIAMRAAGFESPLPDASYTGNMKAAFLATGLFEWRTDFANAQPGDLYLNEGLHVAMCQGGGRLSEFSSSETGGTSGQRGDQTGWESHVTGYYSYPWDGYLHCISDIEIGDDMAISTQDKKDIARMTAEELLNRSLAVSGEKAPVPFWQLVSWTYRYAKDLASRK